MLLCALAEACGDVSFVEELPERLGFPDVTLEWPATRPGGFAARRLDVGFEKLSVVADGVEWSEVVLAADDEVVGAVAGRRVDAARAVLVADVVGGDHGDHAVE